jgi:hypothetical protein
VQKSLYISIYFNNGTYLVIYCADWLGYGIWAAQTGRANVEKRLNFGECKPLSKQLVITLMFALSGMVL